jgi:hypothetical protein
MTFASAVIAWLGASNDSTITQLILVCTLADCDGASKASAIDTGITVPAVAAWLGAGIDSATVIEKPEGGALATVKYSPAI